ncbi:roadblock/LC7 domain-containing protein [Streptomyces sp. NPDC051555]|uniref:roadblock/LC7 domain-containing protein n=1 Tax=Streptomyces sp. NPDC051555 TaxID=3365657 RepID=UPI003796552C
MQSAPVQSADQRAAAITRAVHERCAGTPGVERAVLLSAGGLVLCTDAATDKADAERLAALAASLMSLTKAASHAYDSGWVAASVITMRDHHLCMAPVDEQTSLVVLADAALDTGRITYATAVLAAEVAPLLDDSARDHLGRFFLLPG